MVTRAEVERFFSVTGSITDTSIGDDDGYGGGKGSDYGSDYGYGYGSDYGYGYGSDYSFSLVDANGGGALNGSGYGFGCGRGCGGGDGEGCYGRYDSSDDVGIIEINGYKAYLIDDVITIITHIKGKYAKGYIVGDDLSFSPCFVAKVGNSFAHGKTLKDAVKDATQKELEKLPEEERIDMFKQEFGGLDSLHKGKKYYDWHHILTGSCTMGRDEFCKTHSVDMDAEYTVRYFLEITKNSYGSEIIKQLIESYETI